MNEKLVIIGIYLVSVSAPKRLGTSCGLITLRADRLAKEFTSPGYPRLFTAQTQCTWLIEAPKTDRVKLIIKDFFLTSGERCEGQYVSFRDDATDSIYGPICGKRTRGEIISTGNKLGVKLESDAISRTKRYRGFKFIYSRTKERPTFPIPTRNRLTNRNTPASRGDVIVDDNNNDRINERNRQENQRQEEESQRMNGDNNRNFEHVSPIPPNNGKNFHQGIVRATAPPRRRLPKPTRKINPNTMKRASSKQGGANSKESNDEDPTQKYLAITFSVVIGMVIFTLIIVKIRRKRKNTAKSNQREETQKYSTEVHRATADISRQKTERVYLKNGYYKSHKLPSHTSADSGIELTQLKVKSLSKDRRSAINSMRYEKPKSKGTRKTAIDSRKLKSSQDNAEKQQNCSIDNGISASKNKARKCERNITSSKNAEGEKRTEDRKKRQKSHQRNDDINNKTAVEVEIRRRNNDQPTQNKSKTSHTHTGRSKSS